MLTHSLTMHPFSLAELRSAIFWHFIKIILQHWCFHVKLVKFRRITILKNICQLLLLNAESCIFLDPMHFKPKRYVFWLNPLRNLSLFNAKIMHTYFAYLFFIHMLYTYLPLTHLYGKCHFVIKSKFMAIFPN